MINAHLIPFFLDLESDEDGIYRACQFTILNESKRKQTYLVDLNASLGANIYVFQLDGSGKIAIVSIDFHTRMCGIEIFQAGEFLTDKFLSFEGVQAHLLNSPIDLLQELLIHLRKNNG